jgi:hypothetical protein
MAQTEGYIPRLCKVHLVSLMLGLYQLRTSEQGAISPRFYRPIIDLDLSTYCTRFDEFDPRRFKLRDFLSSHSSELYTTEH